MPLEIDTKESIAEFADRAANNELDIVVILGGISEKNDNGDTIGIHASNIADGDADEMTYLLIRFLEPFTKENPKGAVQIAAALLTNVIKNRHGVELDETTIIKQLVQTIEGAKPTNH